MAQHQRDNGASAWTRRAFLGAAFAGSARGTSLGAATDRLRFHPTSHETGLGGTRFRYPDR